MKPANFAPIYACMYPQLAEIARSHGYALAVHGSMGRDFDLVCIPWTEKPSKPVDVVNEMVNTLAIKTVGEPDIAAHFRIRYTLAVKFGECFIDLSFTPSKQSIIGKWK